ncbi:MAG: alkaline phosphatase family protein [Wenzhouxiangella sp.]|nr:MAG: alkaline phosphatase family protein [Wenzhouxiangella sp.]
MPPILSNARLLAIAILSLGLLACQSETRLGSNAESQAAERPMPLLLISIDGFRHDYFDLAETPALDRLIDGGFKADSLHHVFPTKTFPTHYTVVTGRHPGTHGVVANSMWDPVRDQRFSLGNRDAVGDGYWYQAGEPIWVTAERQGMTAATFFWPGSEARINRIRPTYWKPYAGATPHAERIDQVLAWFDLPDAERPDLVTLYFSTVDSMGHRHGPRADAVRDAIIDVDSHLQDLLNGLDARGLLGNMHIIIVSDHGMSRVDFDQYIMLDEYLDLSRVTVSDWGPAAQIWATDMSAEEIFTALDGVHPNLRVWKRDDIPPRYRFGSHHRVPDVLAEADLEWMISNRPHMAGRSRFSLLGMHGWDPALLEMHGIALMHGPAFAPQTRAPAIRSIDLYALMTHLLGLEPADHEGSLAPFLPYLDADQPLQPETMALSCEQGEITLQLRRGPRHLALHHGQEVHVLDQADEHGQRYEEVDLLVDLGTDPIRVRMDEREWNDCLVVDNV